MEITPLRQRLTGCGDVEFMVTGVGMVEAALSLCRRLCQDGGDISGVVNLGVAGAYTGTGIELLDLCLAKREVIGDLGVAQGEDVLPFTGSEISFPAEFSLQNPMQARACSILTQKKITHHTGVFVTVNAVSGTESRGLLLRDRLRAVCESMEGAAVARTCAAFGLDCLELRSISNLVEDRDPSRWRLAEAIEVCTDAAHQLIPDLLAACA